MKVRALALLLLLPVVFLAACSGGASPPSGGSGATTVVATDYKFDPPNVTARVNQQATITMRNTSTQIHDWTVQGLDQVVVTQAAAGATGTVAFTPTKTGTFKIVCIQAGHEQLGMVGQLTVQ
ncbi:MAG: halocyanin precursor-like protein [Chloroflexi bacterium]|nr:halocyanin precursor-like protein [Chloroflexota bacterium]